MERSTCTRAARPQPWFCGLALLFVALCMPVPGRTAVDPPRIHLLAAAACPPWKATDLLPATAQESCARAAHDFASSLGQRLHLPEEQIHLLIDPAATYTGLVQTIDRLAAQLERRDRLVVFLNFHGGLSHESHDSVSTPTEGKDDEILALWTIERPASIPVALAAKQWIAVGALRQRINRIPVGQLVFILDACYSGASVEDFRRRDPASQTRNAIILSSSSDQVAHFSADWSEALFSSIFSASIRNAENQNLAQAFADARSKTHAEAIAACERLRREKLLSADTMRPETCRQLPTVYDPDQLLEKFSLP